MTGRLKGHGLASRAAWLRAVAAGGLLALTGCGTLGMNRYVLSMPEGQTQAHSPLPYRFAVEGPDADARCRFMTATLVLDGPSVHKLAEETLAARGLLADNKDSADFVLRMGMTGFCVRTGMLQDSYSLKITAELLDREGQQVLNYAHPAETPINLRLTSEQERRTLSRFMTDGLNGLWDRVERNEPILKAAAQRGKGEAPRSDE